MEKLLTAVFGPIEGLLDAINKGVRRSLRALADGPLQDLAFVLIIGITGLSIVLKDVLKGVDRVVAGIEKAVVAVVMLAMVFLSFADYLRRELPGFDVHIEGGPNMAMIGMVWVGFLGASLATRTNKHLSMDATDRLLSPGAAAVSRRLGAAIAAGLCWKLMGYAWTLTAEGLEFEDTLEGLQVWGFLVDPINWLAGMLPGEGASVPWPQLLVAVALAAVALRASTRLSHRSGLLATIGAPVAEAVASLIGFIAILMALPLVWTPTLEFGDPVVWPQVKPGDGFPLWLAQVILPLTFALMALRFGVAAVLGQLADPESGADELEIDGPPRGAVTFVPHPGGKRTGKDIVFAGLFPGLLLGMGAVLAFGKPALILVACVLLVLLGAPLFVAIGVGALACVILVADLGGVSVATDMFEATKKQELLAIPFFVLAGNIMTNGSLAERLIGVARAVMGRTPGGLGLATVFACVVFAAISGSSPVTVIAIGSIMFPMLMRDRYPEDFNLGVLSTAGSLGIIIPPSIPMILYAIMTSTPADPMSPNDLFLAGVLPGLLIALMLAVYTLYRNRPRGTAEDVVLPELGEGYWKNLAHALRRGVLALALPVLILGGIYGVLGPLRFTVTEAAAVAVVYGLVVEVFIHRELSLSKLYKVLVDSSVMMGSLFLIIVLAIAFNKFLAFQQIPQEATEWLRAHVETPLGFLVMVNIFLLLLGMVMEIISAILIVAPLLAPIAAGFGIDPIHFGIIFIVNLELGYLTPPMGINLFVASSVFNRPVGRVIRAVVPFVLIMLVCLVIIAAFPGLSTWLPSLKGD